MARALTLEEQFGEVMEEEEEEEEEDYLVPPVNWAEAPWPPVWKPIEKSPQYLYGMINRFVKPWELETQPLMEDSEFKVPPRPGYLKGPPPRNYHATINTFLKQVRKSRGYDLDVNAPWFVRSPFHVNTPVLHRPLHQSRLARVMPFIIAEINKNAQPHGKCYEFVKADKFVDVLNHRTMLITFTVKEVGAPPNNTNVEETIQAMVFADGRRKYRLIEWRFKPVDVDDHSL